MRYSARLHDKNSQFVCNNHSLICINSEKVHTRATSQSRSALGTIKFSKEKWIGDNERRYLVEVAYVLDVPVKRAGCSANLNKSPFTEV